ncbi:hypothetical protein CKC_00195 [Candidatus Liberibacter solanacearum CLso-ZC1]|uniref:Uncharacterized protein n=1 Tax=Liberibacter solanacearum (strain CLso-ZC1) TaxID=658172 RepID=E4UBQ0_LIBSC|nr:small effector proten [Candidatus Liberibacter solanacearum]ADR51790.1 hypothetical protein CKC_00195 [Candidatus Liberibacter solanacearum CLso-ZC1]
MNIKKIGLISTVAMISTAVFLGGCDIDDIIPKTRKVAKKVASEVAKS